MPGWKRSCRIGPDTPFGVTIDGCIMTAAHLETLRDSLVNEHITELYLACALHDPFEQALEPEQQRCEWAITTMLRDHCEQTTQACSALQ